MVDRLFDQNMHKLLGRWLDSENAHAENIPQIKNALQKVVYSSEEESEKALKNSSQSFPFMHSKNYYGVRLGNLVELMFLDSTASGQILWSSPTVSQFMVGLTNTMELPAYEVSILAEALQSSGQIENYRFNATAKSARKYHDGAFPWVTLDEDTPINVTYVRGRERKSMIDSVLYVPIEVDERKIYLPDGTNAVSEVVVNNANEHTPLPIDLLKNFRLDPSDQTRETNWGFLEQHIKGDLETKCAPEAMALEYQISFLSHLRQIRRSFIDSGSNNTFPSLLAQERGYNW